MCGSRIGCWGGSGRRGTRTRCPCLRARGGGVNEIGRGWEFLYGLILGLNKGPGSCLVLIYTASDEGRERDCYDIAPCTIVPSAAADSRLREYPSPVPVDTALRLYLYSAKRMQLIAMTSRCSSPCPVTPFRPPTHKLLSEALERSQFPVSLSQTHPTTHAPTPPPARPPSPAGSASPSATSSRP